MVIVPFTIIKQMLSPGNEIGALSQVQHEKCISGPEWPFVIALQNYPDSFKYIFYIWLDIVWGVIWSRMVRVAWSITGLYFFTELGLF